MHDFEIKNNVLIKYHGDGDDVVIPEGVTKIGDEAFAGCETLTGITFPKRLTEIGTYAFHYCTALTSIHIPDSVIRIGQGAFEHCSALHEVILPKGLIWIEDYVFACCFSLTDIHILDSVISIQGGAFMDCIGLKRFTLPMDIELVGVERVICYYGEDEDGFCSCYEEKDYYDYCYGKYYGKKEDEEEEDDEDDGDCYDEEEENEDDGDYYDEEEEEDDDDYENQRDSAWQHSDHVAGVFEDCVNLEHISIPSGYLIRFGKRTFKGCLKLYIHYRQYTFKADPRAKINMDTLLSRINNRSFYGSSEVDENTLAVLCVYFSEPGETTFNYIRRNFLEMFQILLDMQETDILRKVIENGEFITKENIDELIQYAIEKKAHEIQVMLMNYKAEKLGYEDTGTTIGKKFKL
ncbi:MAG: leucine-rich repeat domain-containing protein [Oscillospiraceae bacterium]|nr:leucine-rich repeat domain-containing protein [Oscillospiraceae bacterium]